MAQAILITGATGKQGGSVVDALLSLPDSSKFTILGVTRNTESTSAKKLAAKSPNIKVVKGDLDNVSAIFTEAENVLPAGQPIWGVYSVQVSVSDPTSGATIADEIKQGKALVDEAIKHGVKHFVYSSVDRGGEEKSWTNPTPIPHFRTKHEVELYLRDNATASGGNMGWTILRPAAFMDNLVPGFQTNAFLAALRWHLAKDKKLQWAATRDIGVFAAKAFDQPEKWNHKAVSIAGDDLTADELSEAFKRATGSPAPETFGVIGRALTYMVAEVGVMVQWFADEGYGADIKTLKKEHPGLMSMEKWLREKSQFVTK